MFPPESQHHPRPEPHTKANLKTWWHHFNFVQKTKKETHFGEPYKGAVMLCDAAPHNPHFASAAHDTADHPVFGKSLKESLRYASVQISTADANGDLYVWGFIPVVVAKWYAAASCSPLLRADPPKAVCISKRMVRIPHAFLTFFLFLTVSVATEIPGTFRVNGSNKRMRDLQAAFETPPRVSLFTALSRCN